MIAPGSDYPIDPDKLAKWQREAEEVDRTNDLHHEKDAEHQAKVKAQEKARTEEAREALSAMEARKNEALEILKHGDPLQYIREAFSLLHSGDRETIDSITLAIACQSAINTQGIQPNFGGDRGTGKTSGVKAALHLVPRDYILEGSLSNKAFFHFLNSPGMIVFSDDLTLNFVVTATIKRAMSNFQSETHHRTLDKDRKKTTVTIAPRTLFLFTSVNDQGDDQLRDRQFVISYTKTPTANEKFLEFTRRKAIDGTEDLPLLPEVMTARAIFEEIKARRFRVKIPFAYEIKFTDPGQRRNVIIVFDFINAFAVLRFMQREQSHTPGDPDNVITITADPQDAQGAIAAYNMMGPHIQALKLSKDELALWDFIANTQGGEVTFPDLVERYAAAGIPGATESRIRRLLEGRPDRGGGGLVEKIPGLTIDHEIREVSENKKRMVRVIRCNKGPELNEYQEFVSCPACPVFIPLLSQERAGKNEPPFENGDNMKEIKNNISLLSQEKEKDKNEKGEHPQSSILTRSQEMGQGRNIKPDLILKAFDSETTPARSCISLGQGPGNNGSRDKWSPDPNGSVINLKHLLDHRPPSYREAPVRNFLVEAVKTLPPEDREEEAV